MIIKGIRTYLLIFAGKLKTKKCVTLPRKQAYVTHKWAEEQGGCVWWFQAVPN